MVKITHAGEQVAQWGFQAKAGPKLAHQRV